MIFIYYICTYILLLLLIRKRKKRKKIIQPFLGNNPSLTTYLPGATIFGWGFLSKALTRNIEAVGLRLISAIFCSATLRSRSALAVRIRESQSRWETASEKPIVTERRVSFKLTLLWSSFICRPSNKRNSSKAYRGFKLWGLEGRPRAIASEKR